MFAGAVGGAIVVGTSALTANLVGIAAAIVVGYVAVEWLFERAQSGASSENYVSLGRCMSGIDMPEFLESSISEADSIYA